MNCDYIKKRISAIIDKELDEKESVSVNEHLQKCEKCKTLMEEYLNLDNKLRVIQEIEPKRNIIMNETQKQPIFNFFNISKLVPVSGFLILLIILFISFVFFTPVAFGDNEFKNNTIKKLVKTYAQCIMKPSVGYTSFLNFCNSSCETIGNCCCVKDGKHNMKCKGGK